MKSYAVTGAFGFTGKYIARRLLASGKNVITLTNSVQKAKMLDKEIKVFPLKFDSLDTLTASLTGVQVLFNTYWVRFDYKNFNHLQAVQNASRLFEAAQRAGVERIVHVSITNPSKDSLLMYFKGKALMEEALIESGISYAILRPAVLFGSEDILINNIAWAIRHLPVFGLFGDGNYRLQPIFVDDFAQLAVEQADTRENVIINATGPETFTYRELVETISRCIGVKRWIVPMPPGLCYFAGRIIGMIQRDVFITRDEIRGLMEDLLYVDSPPVGRSRLSEWAHDHAHSLGLIYASELSRRRREA